MNEEIVIETYGTGGRMKRMIAIIIIAVILVILFIAVDSRGEAYRAADSVTITGDSMRVLHDKILRHENTLKMYEKMTRRYIFENDSLRMLLKKRGKK
jgi:hypothetical protein